MNGTASPTSAPDKEQVLSSERLVLRPPTLEDCAEIVAWRNSPRIVRFHPSAERLTVDGQRAYLTRYYEKKDDLYFLIEVKEARRKIGTIALYGIDGVEGELGRLLIGEEEYLGRGFMKEAIGRLLRHAFDDLLLEKVRLETFRENEAAFALYLACGFTIVDERRVVFPRNGRIYTRTAMVRTREIVARRPE